MLHVFGNLRECLVGDEFFNYLLEELVELFTVILVVALVHHHLVNLHKLSVFAHVGVVASQEAEQSVDVIIANEVFRLFICEFVSHF